MAKEQGPVLYAVASDYDSHVCLGAGKVLPSPTKYNPSLGWVLGHV